jgi:formylglycine-generating enzyme required for sulfatase activity
MFDSLQWLAENPRKTTFFTLLFTALLLSMMILGWIPIYHWKLARLRQEVDDMGRTSPVRASEIAELRKDVADLKKEVGEMRTDHQEKIAKLEKFISSVTNNEARKTNEKPVSPSSSFTAELELVCGDDVKMKLVWIKPGKFMMGAPKDEMSRRDNEGPQHQVEITKGFYMGVNEVTQEQYQNVMRKNPSNFQGPKWPVEMVTWEEAMEFCQVLNEGKSRRGKAVDLPTEAEWEYACRAGTTEPFCFGKSLSSRQANFDGNYPYGGASAGLCLNGTVEVGKYAPNKFGLYDMHGNVGEWCKDYFKESYYGESPQGDPQGPSSANLRVIRGGSWYDPAIQCRSAYRWGAAFNVRNSQTGFRVVVRISQDKSDGVK